MKACFFVFLGGGLGSVFRYLLYQLASDRGISSNFPWATFAVNILGSFLIGFFYTLSARLNFTNEVRLLFTVGFCGGFTTFSTFSNEGLMLLKTGNYGTFTLYITLSIALGILAVLAGAFISK